MASESKRDRLARIINDHFNPFPISAPADDASVDDVARALLTCLDLLHRAVGQLVNDQPERVQELHRADGKPTGVYICTHCRYLYQRPDQATCCGPRHCSCGAELPTYRSGCDACYARERAEKAAKRWADATPKPAAEYGDGMVLVEDDHGRDWGGRNGWHDSLDDLRDAVVVWREDHPGEPLLTLYVYGSTPRRMTLDTSHLIEDALQDFHEGAHDEISREAEVELQALLDAWCEANGPTTNDVDYGTKIVDWME